METRTFSVGEGKFLVDVTMVDTGRGVTVTLGSRAAGAAHVGATAQAIPRPEPDRTATVSILAVPCHRDEVPAHDIAARVATALKVPVTATCGIHVDQATKEDIAELVNVCHLVAERVVEHSRRMRRSRWDDRDEVVTVDEAGAVIGSAERFEAHTGEGILHQAFSIYLVEGEGPDAKVLLCRRSAGKRLWGKVLADTCAGHPKVGESLLAGAKRRLEEEAGVSASLTSLGHIVYREDHGDGCCEHEWCEVFCGRVSDRLHVNEEEIEEVRRVSFAELDGYLAGRPEQLAPWVHLALSEPVIRAGMMRFSALIE